MISERSNLNEMVETLLGKVDGKRSIVAIAGPPGVGKTTFTANLNDALNRKLGGCCAVLPMDGYHYDDWYLNKKDWRSRKGAPHTFDVGGLSNMLQRLRDNTEEKIAIPVFDREIEIARAGADEIGSSTNIILVEGNYLLLDQAPWNALTPFFDLTIILQASLETITNRLRERWVSYNYTLPELSIKMNASDLPNVDTVLKFSRSATYHISTDESGEL